MLREWYSEGWEHVQYNLGGIQFQIDSKTWASMCKYLCDSAQMTADTYGSIQLPTHRHLMPLQMH